MPKLLIAMSIILFTGALFYGLDWRAKRALLDRQAQHLATAQADLQKARDELRSLPELTRQMEILENELAELFPEDGWETPKALPGNFLAEFERSILEEGFSDPSFTIQAVLPVHHDGCFPCVTYKVQLAGHYATLVDYLHQLGRLKLGRLITIQSLRLARGPGALSINLELLPYRRILD